MFLRWCIAAGLLGFALASTGCPSESTRGECGEPVYGGAASDEAWRTMLDALNRAEFDERHSVSVAVPAADQEFPASATPVFSWSLPLETAGLPPVRQLPGTRPRNGTPPRVVAPRERAALSLAASRAARFVASFAWLEGTAFAHLPPVTGHVFDLRIEMPGEECPLEVLTTELTWAPDSVTWARLARAGGRVLSLQIVNAYLTENRITEGPFRMPEPRPFTVGP